MRLRALAISIGLITLLGAACSSEGDNPTIDAGADQGAAAGDHNDADVTFAQSMIPHHEQAVEMARLATDRAEDERVLDLASRIEAAQAPEIEEMQALLAEWGEDEAAPSGDHGMGDAGEGGMMSAEDMASLEVASGAEFDGMFLEMMIEHHTGAIEMADTEISDGQDPDAIALAGTIKSAQEGEITEMEDLLEDLAA